MANITAMPFRSVDGDRPVSATMDARRFAQYVTNGIDNVGDNDAFKVSASADGLSVVVAPGGAVINGYSGWLDAEETLTPTTPDTSNPRIDRIVFRLNLTLDVRYFQLLLLPGTPAESPVPPSIIRDELIYDLVLADVRISAGSVIITDSSITDQRGDPDLCGRTGTIIPPEYEPKKTYEGEGAPTASTAADIGDVYIDTSVTPHGYYVCLGAANGVYTWGDLTPKIKTLKTEIFTSSQEWTPPENFIEDSPVRIMAFGGGGGGSASAPYSGGGGGHMKSLSTFLTKAVQSITIGVGGAVGVAGGATSFGVLVSASGGSAGTTSKGGDGGTGGGGGGSASAAGSGGNGEYGGGGGGGAAAYEQNSGKYGSGGNGGTFGGGGGGGCAGNSINATLSSKSGKGGSSSNYAGAAASNSGGGGGGGYSAAASARTGGAGKSTTGLGIEFEGSGAKGSITGSFGSGSGGGGYGGVGGSGGGGNGTAGASSGGGGGGYGAHGGNGTGMSVNQPYGGGGGGGYGGAGKNGNITYGGGGGGYGSSNYGAGGNGNAAGTKGCIILQYYVSA